jgi:hypothetical protein
MMPFIFFLFFLFWLKQSFMAIYFHNTLLASGDFIRITRKYSSAQSLSRARKRGTAQIVAIGRMRFAHTTPEQVAAFHAIGSWQNSTGNNRGAGWLKFVKQHQQKNRSRRSANDKLGSVQPHRCLLDRRNFFCQPATAKANSRWRETKNEFV